ncbi:MAG: 50S ribosomal protein L18 [Clostridiales bacterium]|jgi:large subunit ribosomal protein L18|nr:50S ribosomal protein L18 [Clostridiales bacterium]
MIIEKNKNKARKLRHKSARKKFSGDEKRPRLCVFKSLKHIYVQLIDDERGETLVSASSSDRDFDKSLYGGNKVAAKLIGKMIGAKATKLGIKRVVFDRNGYIYHGRVAELAEGAREFLEF